MHAADAARGEYWDILRASNAQAMPPPWWHRPRLDASATGEIARRDLPDPVAGEEALELVRLVSPSVQLARARPR